MTICFRDSKNPNKIYYASSVSWLWTVLFGPIFFAFKGMWIHFIILLPLSLFTFGLASLIAAIFANQWVYNHYKKKGYIEFSDTKKNEN